MKAELDIYALASYCGLGGLLTPLAVYHSQRGGGPTLGMPSSGMGKASRVLAEALAGDYGGERTTVRDGLRAAYHIDPEANSRIVVANPQFDDDTPDRAMRRALFVCSAAMWAVDAAEAQCYHVRDSKITTLMAFRKMPGDVAVALAVSTLHSAVLAGRPPQVRHGRESAPMIAAAMVTVANIPAANLRQAAAMKDWFSAKRGLQHAKATMDRCTEILYTVAPAYAIHAEGIGTVFFTQEKVKEHSVRAHTRSILRGEADL